MALKLKRGARRATERRPRRMPETDAAEAPIKGRGHVEGRGRKASGSTDFSRATLFIPLPTREVLALHGVKHGMSLQEIAEQALDEWLERNGYPAFYPDGWSRRGKD